MGEIVRDLRLQGGWDLTVARMLIVDDLPEGRRLLRVVLQDHACDLVEACEGAQALARARRSPPDLVACGLGLPGIDGYALRRRWKADQRLEHISLSTAPPALMRRPHNLPSKRARTPSSASPPKRSRS